MVVVMAIDYDVLEASRPGSSTASRSCSLVLVIMLGAVSGGARLSFDLGPLKLQPAELAKVTMLLALAAYLGDDERSDEVLPYARFLGGLLSSACPTALIISSPTSARRRC